MNIYKYITELLAKFLIIPAAFFLFFPSAAFSSDTFASFAHSIDAWADGLKGNVISFSEGGAEINLGGKNGVVKGMEFSAARYGEELFNPATGASIGKKIHIVGAFTVSSVSDTSSSVLMEGESSVPADIAFIPTPVQAEFDFFTLNDNERAEASYNVLKNKKFIEKRGGDYIVACVKETRSSMEAECSLSHKSGVNIITARVPLSAAVITSDTGRKNKEGKKEEPYAYNFSEEFISAAAGYALGVKEGFTAAAAEKKSVTVFKYGKTSGFKEAGYIKGFKGIVNIEMADLNGNGIDEIFISDMDKDGNVKSKIYEYKDGSFSLVAKDLNYLFRSYYSEGKKHITCQQFSEGNFIGRVLAYIYDDGVYRPSDIYKIPLGTRLYGFGSVSGGDVTFHLNGSLLLTSPTGTEAFKGYFGDNPHKLHYTFKTVLGSYHDREGNEVSNTDERTLALTVQQRILEIARGKFFLIGNVPVVRKSRGEDDFKQSLYGVYILYGDKPKGTWTIPAASPVIYESDAASIDGISLNILLLKRFNKDRYFRSHSSLQVITAEVR